MKITPPSAQRVYEAAASVAHTVSRAASLVGLSDRVDSAFDTARDRLVRYSIGGAFLGVFTGPVGLLLAISTGATVGAVTGAVAGFVTPKQP